MRNLAPLLALTLISTPCLGIPLTWEASGTFDRLRDDRGTLPVPAAVGDAFRLRFTFENSVADLFPDIPTLGYYQGALLAMSLSVQGATYDFPIHPLPSASLFTVSNRDSGIDSFGFQTQNRDEPAVDTYNVSFSVANVDSSAPPPFQTDALPATPPNPADFMFASFYLYTFDEFPSGPNAPFLSDFLSGQVTSLVDASATPIPEPATLGMMGLGLLGAALAKKRQVLRQRGLATFSHTTA